MSEYSPEQTPFTTQTQDYQEAREVEWGKWFNCSRLGIGRLRLSREMPRGLCMSVNRDLNPALNS